MYIFLILIYMCIHIYIYIYAAGPNGPNICILHLYMYLCIYVFMYIYIYTYSCMTLFGASFPLVRLLVLVCWRTLTYADVRWRMLGTCWRTLTYARYFCFYFLFVFPFPFFVLREKSHFYNKQWTFRWIDCRYPSDGHKAVGSANPAPTGTDAECMMCDKLKK
jgi:hypothetical protein